MIVLLDDAGKPEDRCPRCGSDRFGVNRVGDLGHCFEPQCGHYINGADGLADQSPARRLFQMCHAQLVKDATELAALADTLGVHPQVLADSMVGVVPADLDVHEAFAPKRTAAEERLKAAEALPKKPGRRGLDDPLVSATAALDKVQTAQSHAVRVLTGKAGRLGLFYTNVEHQITRVVLLDPTSGHRDVLEFAAGGLFNHGLFAAAPESRGLSDLRKTLLLMRDELDVLRLQSYAAREAAAEGTAPERGYLWAAATGPAIGIDADAIRELSRLPVFLGDGVPSRQQERVMSGIAERTALDVYRPTDGLTLRDRLVGHGFDVRELVTQTIRIHRPTKAVREEIDEIRDLAGRKMNRDLAHRWAADVVRRDLMTRGTLYFDGREGYVFLAKEAELLLIDPDDRRLRLALKQYGLLPNDDLFKSVISDLRLTAEARGKQTDVHQLAHYDRETNRVYLFDQERLVYRISSTGIDCVTNGTDGVLFRKQKNATKFTVDVKRYPEQLEIGKTLLGGIGLSETWLSRVDQERLIETWMLTMAFPDRFPTRPILALIGERGSGKTSIGKTIGRVLFGKKFEVTALEADEKDCDAAITSESYVVVDNADRELKWIEDKLAVLATGGVIKRRRYYTTNEPVEYPITAFVAITSRTPHFRREDVAERLLVFEVERIVGFEAEGERLRRLDLQRDEIMTSVARRMQRVLHGFARNQGKQFKTNFRMADYADFALRGAESDKDQEAWHLTFAKLKSQQLAFTVEDDPLYERLDAWLAVNGNIGRSITTAGLLRELSDLVTVPPLPPLGYREPRAFGNALTARRGILRDMYGAVTDSKRARTRYWTFAHPARERDDVPKNDRELAA